METVENPKTMPGTEYNILSWWNANSGKYPILSEIARDVFAMQGSSVASESNFSNSGQIIEPYRSYLTYYMVEVLVCSEQWMIKHSEEYECKRFKGGYNGRHTS